MITKLDNYYKNKYSKKNLDSLVLGSIINVKYLISKTKARKYSFTGICISLKNKALDSSIVLRNTLAGTAVEKTFKIYSPLVIDIKKTGQIKARPVKLYYLRNRPLKESKVS